MLMGVEKKETLRELVTRLRSERGLSQAQFGRLIGVDGQTISNIEIGKTITFKLKNLPTLADGLKIELSVVVAAYNESLAQSDDDSRTIAGCLESLKWLAQHIDRIPKVLSAIGNDDTQIIYDAIFVYVFPTFQQRQEWAKQIQSKAKAIPNEKPGDQKMG